MPFIRSVFAKTARLPHLPEVMIELDRATRSDGRGAREIASIVAKDPAVAVKVLRLANSSFYRRPGAVASLEQAIQMVGVSDFRTMILVTCAFDAFPAVPGVNLPSHWAHSTTAGYVTAAISKLSGRADSSSFAAGLLHSMGALLIHLTLPDKAKEVDAVVPPLDFVGRILAERELLGFDHAQVGGEMLTRWKLPGTLCSAVEQYPQHLPSGGDLSACIYCGSVAATGSIRGQSTDEICDSIGDETLRRLQIEPQWLNEELKRSSDLAEDLAGMLR